MSDQIVSDVVVVRKSVPRQLLICLKLALLANAFPALRHVGVLAGLGDIPKGFVEKRIPGMLEPGVSVTPVTKNTRVSPQACLSEAFTGVIAGISSNDLQAAIKRLGDNPAVKVLEFVSMLQEVEHAKVQTITLELAQSLEPALAEETAQA